MMDTMRIGDTTDRTLISFGRNVARIRNERGFSGRARRKGEPRPHLHSGIERGMRNPGIKTVLRIARALNVPLATSARGWTHEPRQHGTSAGSSRAGRAVRRGQGGTVHLLDSSVVAADSASACSAPGSPCSAAIDSNTDAITTFDKNFPNVPFVRARI